MHDYYTRLDPSITNHLLFIVTISHCHCGQVLLSTNLIYGDYACPNSEIMLTCQTIGSRSVVWRSADYIGNRRSLAFRDNAAMTALVGATIRSSVYNTTFATLTHVSSAGDTPFIMISELHVTTRPNLTLSTVFCDGDEVTFNYYVRIQLLSME